MYSGCVVVVIVVVTNLCFEGYQKFLFWYNYNTWGIMVYSIIYIIHIDKTYLLLLYNNICVCDLCVMCCYTTTIITIQQHTLCTFFQSDVYIYILHIYIYTSDWKSTLYFTLWSLCTLLLSLSLSFSPNNDYGTNLWRKRGFSILFLHISSEIFTGFLMAMSNPEWKAPANQSASMKHSSTDFLDWKLRLSELQTWQTCGE